MKVDTHTHTHMHARPPVQINCLFSLNGCRRRRRDINAITDVTLVAGTAAAAGGGGSLL